MHQYEFENLINSNLPKYITDRITFKDIMRVANVLEYSGNLDNASSATCQGLQTHPR